MNLRYEKGLQHNPFEYSANGEILISVEHSRFSQHRSHIRDLPLGEETLNSWLLNDGRLEGFPPHEYLSEYPDFSTRKGSDALRTPVTVAMPIN